MSRHYVGKDIIHYGSGLWLDSARAYEAFDHSARKNIRKAERAGFHVERRSGTIGELSQLRQLWYYPDDPNFPNELSSRDILFMAYLDGNLVGGMILAPVGSHLFLNNLMANEDGKRHQLQGYLLWHAVRELESSDYKYIDIGVSYRANLQRFFTKWSSFRYPVIFNPPPLIPMIRFSLFGRMPDVEGYTARGNILKDLCGTDEVTLVPSLAYAREIASSYAGHWVEVSYPRQSGEVQVVDLTELYPLQCGAIIVGVRLSPEILWERFGCYDHFKNEYLLKCLSKFHIGFDRVLQSRLFNYERFRGFFESEDINIASPEKWIEGFTFSIQNADRLARRLMEFGIEVRRSGNALTVPCHQELSNQDVEYVYAVYRGYLNLCSDWQSTGVKGAIKLTG